MSALPPDPERLQTLIAAYRTLDLDLHASKMAIRFRYKELARIHHPDRHPSGSPAHAQASMRMADINAAYTLIEDAPLKHYRPPADVPVDPAPGHHGVRFDRPVSVAAETFLRMAIGAMIGLGIATWLRRQGYQPTWPYWTFPPLLALGFSGGSNSTWSLVRLMLWWT